MPLCLARRACQLCIPHGGHLCHLHEHHNHGHASQALCDGARWPRTQPRLTVVAQ